jgi:hypothetical protein
MNQPHRCADFRSRSLMSRNHEIHKLSATDSNSQPAHYLVHVLQEQVKACLAAIKADGTMDLEDYGTVIGSCYDWKPGPELRREMWEKYRFKN